MAEKLLGFDTGTVVALKAVMLSSFSTRVTDGPEKSRLLKYWATSPAETCPPETCSQAAVLGSGTQDAMGSTLAPTATLPLMPSISLVYSEEPVTNALPPTHGVSPRGLAPQTAISRVALLS